MDLCEKRREESINWKRNLAVLWVGVFFSCASYTMVVPFLPVYLLQELHVDPSEVKSWNGIVYAVSFLGAAVMAPFWGALADHVGQRRMAIRAGLGLGFTYLLGAITQTPEQFFCVRLFTGIISGFVPAALSLVSSTLPAQKMGWGMGMMQTAVASGGILGPMIGGYLSTWFGMRMSFFVSGAALIVAALMVIFFVRDVKHDNVALSEVHVFADLRVALANNGLLFIMLLFFLVQCCTMIIQPLITLYVAHLMGDVMNDTVIKTAGVVFSLTGIAGIIAGPFWGARGQRYGYTKILCIIFSGAGIINISQLFVNDVVHFAIVNFVYGLFLLGAIPNINARLVEVTDASVRGKSFGLVTSAQQFGGVVGPLVGGLLGGFLSTRYILAFTGCVLLAAAAITFKQTLYKKHSG